MHPAGSVTQAEWVVEGTTHFPEQVADFVPGRFPGYARLLHTIDQNDPAIAWSSVAATAGVAVSADLQWQQISQRDSYDGRVPRIGTLSPTAAEQLSNALAPFTATPDRCYYGLWEGWRSDGNSGNLPTFEIATRTMLFFEGTLRDAAQPFHYPTNRIANVWWPADRAWFVNSEIDFDSTIIAGSRDCIEALLSIESLEILRLAAPDRLSLPAE
jgi:hypothetical protein